jgi:hypothetical protein
VNQYLHSKHLKGFFFNYLIYVIIGSSHVVNHKLTTFLLEIYCFFEKVQIKIKIILKSNNPSEKTLLNLKDTKF